MSRTELQTKHRRLLALLDERGLDAILLQRVSSFAWATCGAASYVNTAATNGPSALLITPSERLVITNNIEAPRLEQEEALANQGWRLAVAPWHEGVPALVGRLTQGLRLGADGPHPGAADLSAVLARLRARLTPAEGERYRALGRLCAAAMETAARSVRAGQTEHEIAACLAAAALARGVQPIVNLVAVDERIHRFRHPLPTTRRLERYAMLVLGGRQRGLVCSLTRLVHLGPLPPELRRLAEATAQVDAALIVATRPGATLGAIFRRGIAAYAAAGHPDEWQRHHQGGCAGYESREYLATPEATDVVLAGQAFAWNPSVTGCKSEDTILAAEGQPEVLTAMPGWPLLSVEVEGQTLLRPGILEV